MTLKDRRKQFHEVLTGIMTNGNVYHQPPENFKLKYPCIVYERDKDDALYADNRPYNRRIRYNLTLIDKDSVSQYLELIMELPLCAYDRHFTSDGLNHDVFTIYY